ncbi:MAG: hypothetical protein IK078_06825 [Lachnospiraceae bacterium]|nr:hypothetical protein [Lachnospiraceae bacterium]
MKEQKRTRSFVFAMLFAVAALVLLPVKTVSAAEIKDIAITFTVPAAGASASTAPTDLKTSVGTIEFTHYCDPATAKDFTNAYTGSFEAGHTYVAAMTLTLPTGDKIATSDYNVTINNEKIYRLIDLPTDANTFSQFIDMSYGDDTAATVTYQFTIPGGSSSGGGNGNGNQSGDSGGNGNNNSGNTGNTGNNNGQGQTTVTPGQGQGSGDSAKAETPTLTVKASKSSAKKNQKKNQTIKLKVTTNSKGKVTYKLDCKSKKLKKYLKISKKGVITIKKKAPKGSFKVTVKVAAKDNMTAVSKTITIKVK